MLFGGARAVLMQAAHPLVIAGARATGLLRAEPVEAAAAHADPDLHDHVRDQGRGARGRRPDQRRPHPDQGRRPGHRASVRRPGSASCSCTCTPAWSTAPCCSRQLTVGRLDDAGRQRFHEEQMLAAELVRIPRDIIPPTVPALRAWHARRRGERHPAGDGLGAPGRRALPPPARGRRVASGPARACRGWRSRRCRPRSASSTGSRSAPARARRDGATFAATRASPPAAARQAPIHRAVPGVASRGRRPRDGGSPTRRRGRVRPAADGDSPPWTGSTGLLLDMDGVLASRSSRCPGRRRRCVDPSAGIPFRIVTNTTTHTHGLATTLRRRRLRHRAGEEIVTAVVGTAARTSDRTTRCRACCCSPTAIATDDLEGVHAGRVDEAPTSSCSAARATSSPTER